MTKRALDIMLSAVGLVVLSPVLAMITLAVWLGGGPVFYSQWRMGRNLRPFRIYKFRTMVPGADRIGGGLTVDGDPRITSLGRILRETKLDELPQLYNVLRGDMSLVGPRPELPQFVWRFPEDYREILRIRPGMTDPASIAYRDEGTLLKDNEDPEAHYLRVILPDKIRLARHYVARHSVLLDLKLVAETVLVLAYPAAAMEGVLDRLAPRHRLVTGLVQSALAAVGAVVALRLRYGDTPPPGIANLVMAGLPIVMVVRAFWLDRTGLTRDVWQYFGADEALAIVAACALGSATLGLLLLGRPPSTDVPMALLVIDAVLCVALLSGARVLRCVHRRLAHKTLAKRRVLIVGTDDEAERVVHGLMAHPLYDYIVLGLVGPPPSHHGLTVHEAPILGCFRQLAEVIRAHDPDEIMVVSSSVPSDERREVVRLCRQSDCPVHVVPDLSDTVTGRSRVEVIDPAATEALLFREPLDLNLALLRKTIAGRRILVTGAGGSIGSEICRQVAGLDPAALVLLERHENSLFELERTLRASHPRLALRPLLGDVRDSARVEQVLAATRPQMVFHAAAYKHVPMVEHNPLEAVKTNVLGTWVVADAAARAGVEAFVLISTDKAVEPVSVMGATKRMAELMVHSLSATSRTRFLAVRFGNVLDSSGSVLPLFREQIRKGGPVTVTHPDATRWFMTVPEAVKLILTASSIGRGGEVFVLDMGKPVRILDLARALIRQYGLRPERDVPIVFTGLRPGERVYERLFGECEVIQKTSHPRILMATNGATNGNGRPHHAEEFHRLLQAVQGAAGGLTPDLRDAVAELEDVCA